MTMREWLRLLAQHNGHPTRTKSYEAFAGDVSRANPRFTPTALTAEVAAQKFAGKFPDVASMIAVVAELTSQQGEPAQAERPTTDTGRWLRHYRERVAAGVDPVRLQSLLRAVCPGAYRVLSDQAHGAIEDNADRAWWAERIRTRFEEPSHPAFIADPTIRYREITGMLGTLTREGAYVRQWAIDRLVGLRTIALDDGADPDAAPPTPTKVALRHVAEAPRGPWRNRLVADEARSSAITPGSIFGHPLPDEPPASPGLSPDQLRAAYAASRTPAAQFRAAQLDRPQENHDG